MASLWEKLEELGVQIGTSQIPRPPQKIPSPDLVEVLDGSWESNTSGDCFVVRKKIPLTCMHGSKDLSPADTLPGASLAQNLVGVSEINRERILFIDTETSGLSGGAGTYVFLVGAAKFEADSLLLAQFFLQDPSQESAQLEALERFASTADMVVSYNGKSFDLPRINTRYAFHCWQSPFKQIQHLDLLHIARRLWKNHLPGCTLGDLEHHLLGVNRSSLDIPGWKVSELFFDYLQSRDPSPLTKVFYHNEMDVISLASLLNYIIDRLADPLAAPYADEPDLISIAEYLLSVNHFEPAIAVLKKILDSSSITPETQAAGITLASHYKSMDSHQEALPLWEQCADAGDVRAHIELAKYHEHKAMDFQEAIHWTLSALDILRNQSLDDTSKKAITEAEYRLARLIRKLSAN